MLPSPTIVVRLLATVALLAAVGWPGAARAHVELVASTPEAGATLSPATERVVLVFGADLAPVGNAIVVRDEQGNDVVDGPTRVVGTTLAATIALTTRGRHTVTYRFVGLDGHASTGGFWFTVAAADDPTAAATARPRAAPARLARLEATPSEGASTSGSWSAAGTVRLLLVLACLVVGALVVRHHAATAGQGPRAARRGRPLSRRRPRS